MKTFTATEAKNNFGVVLEAVDSGVVEVVKNGKPAAYIISPAEYFVMEASRSLMKIKERIVSGDNTVLQLLRGYSDGVFPKSRVLRELGLRFHGQLLDVMGMASLPLPMVPQAELDTMVADALKILGK